MNRGLSLKNISFNMAIYVDFESPLRYNGAVEGFRKSKFMKMRGYHYALSEKRHGKA